MQRNNEKNERKSVRNSGTVPEVEINKEYLYITHFYGYYTVRQGFTIYCDS